MGGAEEIETPKGYSIGTKISKEEWEVYENEYVTGEESIAVLAARAGVSASSMMYRYNKGAWGAKRLEYKVAQRQKMAKVRADIEPIALPPQILQLQVERTEGLGPEYFTEQTAKYYSDGLKQLDDFSVALKQMLYSDVNKKTVNADLSPIEFNALVGAYDKIAERRRIILSIPLTAAVKREIRKARTLGTAEIIEDDSPPDSAA